MANFISLLKIINFGLSLPDVVLRSDVLFVERRDFHEILNLVGGSDVCLLVMPEPPFRPREKLIEHQKYFQSIHKHTYLKGPYDKITSVAIPVALAAGSLYLIGRGIYNMSHGIGRKE
ncbi:hypothetical protein PTKIN_Ptkin03bG0063100 [Pterospermum kingtungense]